jgi:hypothetical protein
MNKKNSSKFKCITKKIIVILKGSLNKIKKRTIININRKGKIREKNK